VLITKESSAPLITDDLRLTCSIPLDTLGTVVGSEWFRFSFNFWPKTHKSTQTHQFFASILSPVLFWAAAIHISLDFSKRGVVHAFPKTPGIFSPCPYPRLPHDAERSAPPLPSPPASPPILPQVDEVPCAGPASRRRSFPCANYYDQTPQQLVVSYYGHSQPIHHY
jgi:hypothetical protein